MQLLLKFYIGIGLLFLSQLNMAFDYSKDPILELKGKKYFTSDLPDSVRLRIFDIQTEAYNTIKFTIDQYLLSNFFENEAKKKNTTVEAIKAQYLKITPVTQKDIKDFYNKNKSELRAYSYEEIKDRIKKLLETEKLEQVRLNLLNKIKKDLSFKILIPEPVKPVVEFDINMFPFRGSDNPRIVIIEFGDYQCIHCRKASNELKKVLKKYHKEIKIVFIHFYLYEGSYSQELAKGAYCAKEQGKFWEYHDLIYSDQTGHKAYLNTVHAIAEEIKLDMDKFQKCLQSTKAKDFVYEQRLIGDKKGVRATPTFFINGEKYVGDYSYNVLEKYIQKILSK